ncbi:unnamed protein product, partial [Linum tenue]
KCSVSPRRKQAQPSSSKAKAAATVETVRHTTRPRNVDSLQTAVHSLLNTQHPRFSPRRHRKLPLREKQSCSVFNSQHLRSNSLPERGLSLDHILARRETYGEIIYPDPNQNRRDVVSSELGRNPQQLRGFLCFLARLSYALFLTLKNRADTSSEIIAIASAILSLLGFSCLAAFPLVRHLHHNFFDQVHRFTGWTSLCLLWASMSLSQSRTTEQPNLTSTNWVRN